MEHFYIVSNVERDPNHESAAEIKRYLENHRKCGRIVGDVSEVEDTDWADMVIVLGGDGSVIQTAKRFAGRDVPILGVNFGTLGYEIERRIALTGSFDTETGERKTAGPVINEFIIGKRDFGRMITARVFVDGHYMDTYVADAVLVSTPTGSTAYNLAASGPVLEPAMEAMIITPICPHSLNKRSLVVSSRAKIRIEVGRTKDYYEDVAEVSGDGEQFGTVSTGDIIDIQKAQETFDMVRLGEVSFFDKMRSKLNRD